MLLQQMPDKPAGRGALLPQGIQSCLERSGKLNQHSDHFHEQPPLFNCMLLVNSIACQLLYTWDAALWYESVMSKPKGHEKDAGSWVFREIPRDLMHKMKIAAAVERKSVKQLLIELSEAHIQELEKKGLLPKGR